MDMTYFSLLINNLSRCCERHWQRDSTEVRKIRVSRGCDLCRKHILTSLWVYSARVVIGDVDIKGAESLVSESEALGRYV